MLKEDRVMLRDIEAVVELIRGGELVEAAERDTGQRIVASWETA